ncbi:MAG: hypothetical protein F6K10_26250 [Moorea sp. SIO2B7]|nr:hypothetical protein [Moorena sp. SIO2B7]
MLEALPEKHIIIDIRLLLIPVALAGIGLVIFSFWFVHSYFEPKRFVLDLSWDIGFIADPTNPEEALTRNAPYETFQPQFSSLTLINEQDVEAEVDVVRAQAVAVPEPETVGAEIVGILGFGFLLRKKFKQKKVSIQL